jgi:hypothetical protein
MHQDTTMQKGHRDMNRGHGTDLSSIITFMCDEEIYQILPTNHNKIHRPTTIRFTCQVADLRRHGCDLILIQMELAQLLQRREDFRRQVLDLI